MKNKKKLRWNPKGVFASVVSEVAKVMMNPDQASALANIIAGGASAIISGFSIKDASTPASKYIDAIEKAIYNIIAASLENESKDIHDIVQTIVSTEDVDPKLSDKDKLFICIKESLEKNNVYLGDVSEIYISAINDITESILSSIREAIESDTDLLNLDTNKTVHDMHKRVLSIENKMDNLTNVMPQGIRFDADINKKLNFNILSDYCEYEVVKPVVSYGMQKDVHINQNENSFEMTMDVKDGAVFGKQEFIMALFKYSPSEDMSAFWRNGYSLEFDINSSSGIQAVQLEIKDGNRDKVVDRKIQIQTHQKFLLSKLTRTDHAWKNIHEICFTIFLNEDYLSESKGKITVSNLLLTPNVGCIGDNEMYASNFKETLFLHRNRENPIRLCDIFVPHNYESIRRNKNSSYGKLPCGQSNPPNDILEYVKHFVRDRRPDEGSGGAAFPCVLFVEGDAGVGKSSFVSYLAHSYAEETSVRQDIFGSRKLICVRLRELMPESMKFSRDSINQTILQYLGIESPEKLKEQYTGSVFVLDGFDELCMIEGIGLNKDSYIYDLHKLFDDCRLIITTRPKYLDLFKIDIPIFHIVLKHFDSQQRKEWVENYRRWSPDSDEKFGLDYIENISDDDAIGVCDTPMALYMIAAGKINEEATKNNWVLYHQIFYKELHEREYNSVFPTAKDGVHRHPISVYKYQLYQTGSEIAYEIYKKSNAVLFLTKEEVLKIVENMGMPNADVKELVKHCYALCSYWKANADKGVVEFFHNNIRDFFMCEKIVYEVNKLYNRCKDMSLRSACEEIAEGLHAILHHSEVNAKVIEFLYLRVLYQMKSGNTESFVKIEQTKKYLEEVLSYFIYGKLTIQREDRFRDVYYSMIDAFVNVVQLYRHAFEPYLYKDKSVINWGFGDVGGSSSSHTVFTSTHFKRVFIKEPLIIGGITIYTAGRANFNGVRLEGADLRFAGFSYCKMRIANLSNTILLSANFEGSDLTGTSFAGADLRHASFKDCIIEDCDFTGAYLVGTIFPDGYSFECVNDAVEYLKNANISGIKA